MNQSSVYSEVLEMLNNIPYRDYLKIPQCYIQFLNNNKSNIYIVNSQEISRDVYCLFLKIYLEYIANDKEKKQINEILKINTLREENNKKRAYNSEIIFSKTNIYNDYSNPNLMIVEEKWYHAIIKKIKCFFRK